MDKERGKPTVSVAMSSYNGEQYIADQIESILSQKDVVVDLVVRDDGSKDHTRDILRKYAADKKLTLIEGENVGYIKSFMEALFACGDSEYYAFADQDDIWFDDKLIKTIKAMGSEDEPHLGFCNSYFTDEDLNIINNGYPDNYKLPEKEMVFCSVVASGYLVVMNNSLVRLLRRVEDNIPIGHDVWVGAVAMYFGRITYLKDRLVYHRRLKNSVSRLPVTKLLKNRMDSLFHDNGKNIECAILMLDNYKDLLTEDEISFLTTVRDYRMSRSNKVKLLRNKKIYYSMGYGRLTPKIKILLNRF